MKKMWFVLCVLLLVPTLALANSDMVSISELRQQVEAMGRWTKTYEAYGRTIEVDVPIIVPEVEKMPIVMIEPWRPYDEESWLPHQKSLKRRNLAVMITLSFYAAEMLGCTAISIRTAIKSEPHGFTGSNIQRTTRKTEQARITFRFGLTARA